MNSQLNATNARPDESPVVVASPLTWFADHDGVHRYRRNAGSHWVPRAHIYFEKGWQWVAYADNFANVVESGVAASLELAKAAAERAVREMDGEGEK